MEDSRSLLRGKHLIVSGLDASVDFHSVRNSSGHVLRFEGVAPEALNWLMLFHQFTYSPLQLNNTPLDDSKSGPGLITLLKQGKCDILTSVTPTYSRAALVDFSHPSIYIPASFLIPTPESVVDVLSITEPFQRSVWIGIFAAFGAIFLAASISLWQQMRIKKNPENKGKLLISSFKKDRNKIGFFIYGLLLKQAGFGFSRNLSIRTLLGAWGLAVFVIGNHYTSLLTAFITAPNPQPLIRSIYELQTRPDLRLVSNADRNTAAVLLSADSGFYKVLGDKLKADPQALCSTSKQCVNMVKAGRTVYTAGKDGTLLVAMLEDFRNTGKCNLELGKDNFLNLRFTWATAKKSPYIDTINKGTMRMREAGLISKWFKDNSADVHRCLSRQTTEQQATPKLALKNLSGAFVALMVGFIISFLLFLGEMIRHNMCTQK